MTADAASKRPSAPAGSVSASRGGALRARALASLQAAIAGWCAAMAVTLPMQWFRLWSDADGGLRPMPWSVATGTAVWLGWSLSIVGSGWALGALPAVVLIPHRWISTHRRVFVAVSASLAWVVVLVEFKTWKLLIPGHTLAGWLFSLYSLLLVVFAWTAAVVYLRLAAKIGQG